jgi:hypothetical protein
MPLLLFVAAVSLLLAAHIVRTVRWRILLSGCGIEVSNVRPLAALSVGYLINALLPYRLGEIIRVLLLSYSARSRFSSVFATVLVERLSDLFVIALFMFVSARTKDELDAPAFALGLVTLVLAVVFVIKNLSRLRRGVWMLSSIFNEGLKSGILHFFFTVIDLLFSRSIFWRGRFWLLTCIMWFLYAVSLQLFAYAVGVDFLSAFTKVYMSAMNAGTLLDINILVSGLFLYLILPIPLVLIYAYFSGFNALSGLKGALRDITRIDQFIEFKPFGLQRGFKSEDLYHSFLDRYFHGRGGLLSMFEQRGINDVQVHRIFQGGSGAVTALIEIDNQLCVRKFASGSIAGKLIDQHNWLKDNASRLPLVQVLASHSLNEDYSYDMVYLSGSRNLYEGIHTDPVEKSIQLIDCVIGAISKFHDATTVQNAEYSEVADYVDSKVIANFATIEREFDDILQLDSIELNGETFKLSRLKILKDREWFISRLRNRRQSSIHGDLTIENIILDGLSDSPKTWFLIDPNPINGFQSPLIDFAKLMQSLHLGYESLHKMPRAKFSASRLVVGLHRSSQYERIHVHVVDQLRRSFGSDVLKEIDLHEIINFLRLIPYQLRSNKEAGLAFFGCLCMLIREFDNKYLGEIEA